MVFKKQVVCRIAPFGAYVFFMLLEDALFKWGWDANELRSLYVAKIAVVASLLWWFRKAYRELQWPVGIDWRTWIAAIVAGVVVFIAWINLTANWMVMGESVAFDPRENNEIDWLLAGSRLIGATLIVPVMEELFWRSFLMRWLCHPEFLTINPMHVGIKALLHHGYSFYCSA